MGRLHHFEIWQGSQIVGQYGDVDRSVALSRAQADADARPDPVDIWEHDIASNWRFRVQRP